jgi:hypothetical protein
MAGGCGAADKPAGELELELQEAFRSLYFSNFGRNYPGSATLATCTPEKDEPCYKIFNRVMDAKQFIVDQIQLDADLVLGITLNTIFDFAELIPDYEQWVKLHPGKSIPEELTCQGAIIALYFFDQDDQDRVILNRIKTASPDILDRLFHKNYEWHYNRPDRDRWVAFVESIPETDFFSASWKRATIEAFRLETPHFREFGIMLNRQPHEAK